MLPFVNAASFLRMMGQTLTGGALAVVSAHVVIASGTTGAIAGSVLPGLTLAMLGLMSCVSLMAGGAVRKFKALRVSKERPSRCRPRRAGRRIILRRFVVVGRLAACSDIDREHRGMVRFVSERNGKGQVTVSGDAPPMVAADVAQSDHSQRVLALYADSRTDVSYSIMCARRAATLSTVHRVYATVASGGHDDTDNKIGELAA